ncbi:hypothetical protein K1719_006311 [Acacia pycnantha]|nr:hypothetical protein K1719_006311 [Acacia pycnantha]
MLLSITGFGWNPVLKTATTEDASLWDVHVKDNSQWEKFRKSGLPYWEQLVDIFGDVYASGDGGVGNAEALLLSDGDGDNNGSLVETTNPVLHRQEYQEDEHLLNDELFAPDPVETPNPVLHRQDRTPNAKRRRRSGNADVATACQAIHDLVKIRQNQCDNNFANSGLEDEEYIKAARHVVESQAWRVAFVLMQYSHGWCSSY